MTTLTLNRTGSSSNNIFSETLKAAAQKAQAPVATTPAPVPTLLRAWQWLQGKLQARAAGKSLELTGTLALGEKRTIFVVQVSGRKFLVGGTPNNLTMLADLGPVEGSPDAPAVPMLPAPGVVRKERRRRTPPALTAESADSAKSASASLKMPMPVAAKTVASPRRSRKKTQAAMPEMAIW